jgi:hypothetical protein
MKKLLLILFLIPNLIMAEESKWKRKETITPAPIEQTTNKYQDWLDANPDKAGTEDYITVQKAAETYNVEPEERTTNLKYRNYCAMQAGDAKSDFAAKKMYETCLDQYRVPK